MRSAGQPDFSPNRRAGFCQIAAPQWCSARIVLDNWQYGGFHQ